MFLYFQAHCHKIAHYTKNNNNNKKLLSIKGRDIYFRIVEIFMYIWLFEYLGCACNFKLNSFVLKSRIVRKNVNLNNDKKSPSIMDQGIFLNR